VPTPDLTRVQRDFADQIQTSPILGTLYLALDVSEPPLRENRDLRQALSMAIDRSFIAEHLTLGVTPAYSFVARGIKDYEPPSYLWASWPRDQQLSFARKLYERAGYSQKHPLHLKLYFNSGEGIQRIMVAVAAGWKQNLGVETTLLIDEFRVFLTGRKDRSRWDVARLGWWADYNDPASFLDVFSKTSSQNDPDYRSSEFNSLLDSARADADSDERLMLLRKAEEVLLNDYPILPIYFYTATRLVKPYVGGAQISALRRTYSKHLFWKAAS
jgi:oligopeptide transport system substrate-binding protein